jgi:hypothetical protein
MTGANANSSAAWAIVPFILIAECFSWHGVLTKNYLSNAIENTMWAFTFLIVGIGVSRLLPEFEGLGRGVLIITIVGIARHQLILATIDMPMYLRKWKAERAAIELLRPLEGLWDATVRWVVTRDVTEWKGEVAWMSLYFSVAVWASLALCVCYAFAGELLR